MYIDEYPRFGFGATPVKVAAKPMFVPKLTPAQSAQNTAYTSQLKQLQANYQSTKSKASAEAMVNFIKTHHYCYAGGLKC